MEKQERIAKINEILIDKLVINNPDELRPEARLAEDLAADSLDAIEITMDLERTFGISITDYQLRQMTESGTVQDVYNMVDEALK